MFTLVWVKTNRALCPQKINKFWYPLQRLLNILVARESSLSEDQCPELSHLATEVKQPGNS